MAKKANLNGEKFGIEIEVAGQSRSKIAQAVAEATGGRITARNQGPYQATLVKDEKGREWKIHNDASIATVNGHKGSEIVSPVLTYPDDIEMLQEVVRKVRAAGGQPHKSCSVHCHIDSRQHTVKSLNNLAKMVYKNEDLIFQALNVSPNRRNRWARLIETDFIDKLVNHRPRTKDELNEAWFGRYNGYPARYTSERYHGLNYVNLWRSIETIEFRYGQASLHAGRIKSLVQFYLALGVKARNAKATSHKKIETNNPKFNFRVWLVSGLGMIGNEFKIARNTLTKNLPGNCAWR